MANVKIISPGIFLRGIVLGEFGANNISGPGLLNRVLSNAFDDTRGWSDQKLLIVVTPLQIHIPESVSVWRDILDDLERNLLLGGEIREVIRDLTYVNTYACLTSTDPKIYTDGMRMANILLQHLVFFEQALRLPQTWQRLQ